MFGRSRPTRSERSGVECLGSQPGSNLSMAPRPCLAWFAHQYRTEIPKNPGHLWNIYWDRLDASAPGSDREIRWSMTTPTEAELAALDMVAKLTTDGLPTLTGLLDRQNLLEAIQERRSGGSARKPT